MNTFFDNGRQHPITVTAGALLLLLFVSVTFGSSKQTGQNRPPNIIFIHADDLGYGDLSCYGQRRFHTPHLDRMAAEGTRFTNYYSGSTVCAPSRYALMTGIHTGHGYIRGNGEIPLRPADITIAEVVKAADYRTAVIGKWGLGTENTAGRPDRQGFDESFGFLDHRHAHRQYTDHLWKNVVRFPVDAKRDFANDLFTDAALNFIARHKERPFFLYLAYTNPHAELRVPEDSLQQFRGKFPETPFVNTTADNHASVGYRSQPTPHAAFAAMVTRMDRDVGRILADLAKQNLDNNTIVFFTSDNGPHEEGGADPGFFQSAGNLRGIKRDLYEGGVRVPMIARWPGRIAAGRVSSQIWAHWDVLPTAAQIAGAQAPTGIDGISMLPALLGRSQQDHDFLYWEFHERGFDQAVRMGEWKAVRHGTTRPLELYNLLIDIGEQKDVAAQHPAIVNRINDYLKTARTESERWKIKPGSAENTGQRRELKR